MAPASGVRSSWAAFAAKLRSASNAAEGGQESPFSVSATGAISGLGKVAGRNRGKSRAVRRPALWKRRTGAACPASATARSVRTRTSKRQAEAHLIPRHRPPGGRAAGDRDADGSLKRLVGEEPMGRRLSKSDPVPAGEVRRIGRVELEGDLGFPRRGTTGGEELLVLADDSKALGDALFLMPPISTTWSGRRRCAVSCRAELKTLSISWLRIIAVAQAAAIHIAVKRRPSDSPSRPEGCPTSSRSSQSVAEAAFRLDDRGPELLAQAAHVDLVSCCSPPLSSYKA